MKFNCIRSSEAICERLFSYAGKCQLGCFVLFVDTQVRLPYYVYNYSVPPNVRNPVLPSKCNQSLLTKKLKQLLLCRKPIHIVCAIQNDIQITIIHGKTGCGKTSLLPQFIIEIPKTSPTLILMAMPRRVAVLKSNCSHSMNVYGSGDETHWPPHSQ